MLKSSITVEELLEAKEGEQYQFKEAKNRFDSNDAARCCCALANCGGGMLVFGITDKRPRRVVGSLAFNQPERTRKWLMESLKVMVDFQLFEYEGKRVLVFEIAARPLGLPVQFNGIPWWYDGDSLIPMPELIRRDIYAETGMDFSGMICTDASLDDLDETAIEIFRDNWVKKSGNDRLRTLSAEQLLCDCEVITDEGITYAALILFGKKAALGKYLPQSEIIFEYRSSEASGPASQREEFRMGFFAYYDRLWELINLRNDKQHYQEGFLVRDIPTFNERVIREAILNAVCHRNYQMSGSVFIRQYRERLVVESPGGFPNGITLENILNRQSPRNRRIAEILSLSGLVERSGQGMNLIYELSITEAKPLPDFTGTDENFVSMTLNGLIIDKRMLEVINQIGNERWESFSTEDFLLIDALYHEKSIPKNLRPRLKHLMESGIVEHIGHGKYVLSRNLYDAVGKPGVHTRVVGLDRDTNKELIVKHIRGNGEKGTPLREILQVLPGKSRSQIQVLLRELRRDGRIFCEGKTSGARWYAVDVKEHIDCN
ncbi:MAG: putative DNA binding domain-containing protein [Lachnospiraceae bacterium]|nr:putative DNA binding domain-containing protein [Lachnospiraceae bacterium]